MRRVGLIMVAAGLAAGVVSGQAVPPPPTPVGTPATLTEKGIALVKEGKYPAAKTTLARALAANPADAAAHAYLGLALLNHDDDTDQAATELGEAVRLEPGRSPYHQWLGAVYSRQATEGGLISAPGLAKKARTEFLKAVELDPKDLEARASLLEFYLRAPGIVGGSVPKAREQALAMTEIDRHQGLLAQARIAEHEKDDPGAERLYRSAIAVKPDQGEAYNQLGYLLLRTKRRDEAVATFRKYVEVSPGEANPHDSLGEALLAQGEVDASLAEYQKALEIDPAFPSAFLGLAQCFERKDQWADAQKALERYIELEPEGRRTDDARDKLQELKRKQR
ncbi:MAG TPA: tetratricopeptide repeat protein [Thermoanaerobaculaceae bacterium]|nr:tetratricopeptide repeat protein [Thermoanaerobaculaceae bacterium]